MKLGFIGLGQMGSGMARNLLRAGHELVVYNRTRAKAEAIEGARVADSPADAAKDVDAVITMLGDDRAVEDVVFGDRGIAATLQSIHISSSTISTALVRRLTSEHANRKQGFISAPVFGRPESAEAKKLVVTPAGPPDLIDRCRQIFDAIGRETFIVGNDALQANSVKLCGNFMIASVIETFGEAFATMRKCGVDPHAFLEIMNALFASPIYANYGKIIADERFEPAGFALKLGLKDIGLVMAVARECTSPMPIASVVRDRCLAALANGQGEMDWSSIAKVAAREAGLA